MAQFRLADALLGMPRVCQIRKEASPPPNKPFHRICGKRRPPPGELHDKRMEVAG